MSETITELYPDGACTYIYPPGGSPFGRCVYVPALTCGEISKDQCNAFPGCTYITTIGPFGWCAGGLAGRPQTTPVVPGPPASGPGGSSCGAKYTQSLCGGDSNCEWLDTYCSSLGATCGARYTQSLCGGNSNCEWRDTYCADKGGYVPPETTPVVPSLPLLPPAPTCTSYTALGQSGCTSRGCTWITSWGPFGRCV